MTRDELVDTIGKPIHEMRFKGDVYSTIEIIMAVLSAIEASGYAIVPVEANEAMVEAAWGAMFEEPYDCTSDHMIKAGCDAMIKAGKI